jgi:hypothetical protein|tara:strand:+ start:4402 stop:4635 length:234 start_codon:yes stop_codon:yes gene_type:complete
MLNVPLSSLEQAGLLAHGLATDKSSQLSDSFRLGVAWALKNDKKLEAENIMLKEVINRLRCRRGKCAVINGIEGLII